MEDIFAGHEPIHEKVVLIDIDSIIYMGAFKDTVKAGISTVNNRINSIIKDNESNNIISFDTPKDVFRKGVARTKPYKYNRKDLEKPKHFDSIKKYVKDTFNVYTYEGLEADDCVSYFATKFKNNVICAIDKDVIKQCVGTHYNYQLAACKKTGYFNIKGFQTTTEEEADRFLWQQALTGDSTDGILGIEKVGEKTAQKWLANVDPIDFNTIVLQKYVDKYGRVEGTCRFAENFRLVYLLKTDEDIIRELGSPIELPKPEKIILI